MLANPPLERFDIKGNINHGKNLSCTLLHLVPGKDFCIYK